MSKIIKILITVLIIFVIDTTSISNKIVFADNSSNGQDNIGFVEFILDLFAKYINLPLGDTIQKTLDQACTNIDEDEANVLLYSRQEFESLNNYFHNDIQVDKADSTKKTNTFAKEDVSNTKENKSGVSEEIFNAGTSIPAIPIDAYTMTASNPRLFNIDFLGVSEKENKNFGDLYRNFINTLSHIILYVCAALLIIMLIWRSILLVTSIYGGNTETAKNSKKIIDNYFTAVLILVGVYLFSTLMVNLYTLANKLITNGVTTYFPIRYNVKDVYSFNTNIISAVRYNTLSTNILDEYMWSLVYLGCAFINLFWFVFMFFRMIIVGGLIVIAPVTAVTTMTNTTQNGQNQGSGLFFINGWIKVFLTVVWVPFILTALISLALRL